MKISALIRQYCIRVCYRRWISMGLSYSPARGKKIDFAYRRLFVNLRTKVHIKHSGATRLVIVCATRNGLTGIDCQIRVGWRDGMWDLTTNWIRPVLLNAISPRLIVLAKLLCYELRWTMTSDSNGEIWISMVRIADHLSSKFNLRAWLNKSDDIMSRFFSGIKW